MKKVMLFIGLFFLPLAGCTPTDTIDDVINVETNGQIDDQTNEQIPEEEQDFPDLIMDAEYSHTQLFVFGPVQITIYGIDCTEDEQGNYVDERCHLVHEAFDRIDDMARRFTVNEVGGEVERINEMAGIRAVEVNADTFDLISQAVYYSIYSDAAFNVAIGPLSSLWNIAMPGVRRPTDEEINEVLPLLNPSYITLDADAQTVFLEKEGMRLDLGGIAKGFMPDEIVAFFQEEGINHALIIVGGEVIALNGRPNGNSFTIGVRNPFFDDESPSDHHLAGTLPIYNEAMVTSGTYERYFAHQESLTFYHHLFDSHTGFPFDSNIVSLTVIADTGLLGEVYTKVLFALEIADALAYVESLDGIEALIISDDGGIYLSTGLQDRFDFWLPDVLDIRTP